MPTRATTNSEPDALKKQADSNRKVSPTHTTVVAIILAIGGAHHINDASQSLIPAIFPLLQKEFSLDFTQIGLVGLTFQLCASLLQPFVGMFTDQRRQPFSLSLGMTITMCGLIVLSFSSSLGIVLVAVGMVG